MNSEELVMKKLSTFAVMLVLPLFVLGLLAQEPEPNPGQPEESTPQAQSEQPSAAVLPPGEDHLKKGMELNQAKQYAQAETALRAAVAARPADPTAHFQLGVSLYEQGKLPEAETAFEQAKPLIESAQQQQASYYKYRGAVKAKREKWSEAVQDLEKAVQLNPTEPYNHYHIGVAYNRLKRPDKMVEHLQMFLKLAPNAPEAPKCRALLRAVQ
jgi:tetratricopeptide (TPR) repeat protein